jgi:hypothetical protein
MSARRVAVTSSSTAGEATSVEFHATAHGAYLSGVAAARAVARSLGRKVADEAAAPAE